MKGFSKEHKAYAAAKAALEAATEQFIERRRQELPGDLCSMTKEERHEYRSRQFALEAECNLPILQGSLLLAENALLTWGFAIIEKQPEYANLPEYRQQLAGMFKTAVLDDREKLLQLTMKLAA